MCSCNKVDNTCDEHGNYSNQDEYLDFDEFLEIMKDKIKLEKSNMQDCEIAFESSSSNVSCLFWPY